MSILNTVIWITGASSGIGKALAIEFSQQNVKLILSSRKKADLELVKTACKFPSNVEILGLDLEDYSALPRKAAEAIALFGGVDILVNNGWY